MAAGGRDLHPVAKAAVVAGCGVALTGLAYYLYKRLNQYGDDSSDEGFEDAPKTEEPEKKVLMLGLDGAGKSSLLASLGKQDSTNEMQPTEGFNVMCVQTENVSLNIWEIGGAASMRDYWKKFLNDTAVLCYVVDSSDEGRLDESVKELKSLLKEDPLKGVGVIIVANKQDLPGAKSAEKLREEFGLDMCIVPTQVPRGSQHEGVTQLEEMLISVSS